MTGLVVRRSIFILASPAEIWEALITPELIKQYLFGTEAASDWKPGSPIRYRGVWQGRPYEDKGTVVTVVPRKLLATTYWSSFSGRPDVPENYCNVTYELTPREAGTELTVTQDNNPSEEARKHSEENWGLVLGGLKKLLERR